MLVHFLKQRWFVGVNCGNRMMLFQKNGMSSRISTDIELNMTKKLRALEISKISIGIKKSVKNGFVNKTMFDCYNDLIRTYQNHFNFRDIVLLLQSYALCKERNFEIYSLLSNRLLYLLKEKQIEYTPTTYDHMYRYIIASNELNYSDFELLSKLLHIIKENLHCFEIKKIAKLVHAQSKLKIYDEELLEVCKVHILNNFEKVKASYINHLISGYSKSENKKNYAHLFNKLIHYIYHNVNSFDSISLYNILLNLTFLMPYGTEQHCSNSWNDSRTEQNLERSKEGEELFLKVPREKDVLEETCHLNSTEKKNEALLNVQNKEIYENRFSMTELLHVLFTKVNSCLAFLSFNQLIKLLGAYKDLNYFNYFFIYKRLLHFLLAKAQSNKIKFEEGVLIFEFLCILPYINETVEQIINVVLENLEKIFVVEKNIACTYSYICRLFVCFKKLNINSDAILSKLDCFIFKNKKTFEKNCTYEHLELFLSFFKNAEEWAEICSYLNSLKNDVYTKERKNFDEEAKEINETIVHRENILDISRGNNICNNVNNNVNTHMNDGVTLGTVDKKLITYKYDKLEKRFRKQEIDLNDASMKKTITNKEMFDSDNDKAKQISNYLYFNSMNEKENELKK